MFNTYYITPKQIPISETYLMRGLNLSQVSSVPKRANGKLQASLLELHT